MTTETIYTLDEILKFVIDKSGCPEDEATPQCDIITDLGVWGDDLHELIFEYSKVFKVDMDTYLWYFHTEEEGNNIGAIFFKTPYQLVKHIAITPNLLLESANEGKWMIVYPEHTIPKRRYDILINYIFIFILLLIILAIDKCH